MLRALDFSSQRWRSLSMSLAGVGGRWRAEPDRSELGRDEPDRSEPDLPEPDRSEPDLPEPDRSEPDLPEPDRSEPDRSEPDRAGPDCPLCSDCSLMAVTVSRSA